MTGHSLGGGVGTLVSYAAQSYLNQQMGAAAPAVSSVLFAPPNAGSPEFVDSFNQLVNARRLAFEYDIVPQVRYNCFCLSSVAGCLLLPQWASRFARCGGGGACLLMPLPCSCSPSCCECTPVSQAFCTPEMPSCPPGRLPGTVGALLTAVGAYRPSVHVASCRHAQGIPDCAASCQPAAGRHLHHSHDPAWRRYILAVRSSRRQHHPAAG